jgi:hypothetical protein
MQTNSEPSNYSLATALRRAAERYCDPDKYLIAAAEFAALGMDAAAEACTMRARHYQDITIRIDVREEIPA